MGIIKARKMLAKEEKIAESIERGELKKSYKVVYCSLGNLKFLKSPSLRVFGKNLFKRWKREVDKQVTQSADLSFIGPNLGSTFIQENTLGLIHFW
jgi:hypothetical protein